MTAPTPPRLATWLLEKGGPSARAEELIGDLVEEYGTGRTRTWFWRQVAGVLMLDLWRVLHAHALTFAAAVAAGSLFMALWTQCIALMLHGYGFVQEGEAVATHPQAMSHFLVLRISQILTTVLVVMTVWIVTRIHKTYQRGVVVAFVMVTLAPRLPGLADMLHGTPGTAAEWHALLPSIVGVTIQALVTTIVGLWVIKAERLSEMHPRLRAVLLLVVLLAVTNATLRSASLAGLLSTDVIVRYALVALEIAGAAYLVALLWRQRAPQANTA